MRRWALLALVVGVGGCSSPSSPAPSVLPSQPTPAVILNRAPSLAISFTGGSTCTLGPNVSCEVFPIATAVDPDGDSLTYSWSGCAGGKTAGTHCGFNTPDQQSVTVTVNDGQGHEVSASATASAIVSPTFVNHPPVVHFGYDFKRFPNSSDWEALPWLDDGEGNLLCGGPNYSTCKYLRDLTITGDCKPTYVYECSCLTSGTLDIFTTKTAGSCELSITVVDNFGLAGTTKHVLNYGPVPSIAANLVTFGPRPSLAVAKAAPDRFSRPLRSAACPQR